jgi:hypothetical protein
MRRLHLFEWEDQPWLPRVFRDFITDHLRFTHNEAGRRPVNCAIASRLQQVLQTAGTTQVVDLCSGAGGPLPAIASILGQDYGIRMEVLLTDLFPNRGAFQQLEKESGGHFHGRYDPTPATDVPEQLKGVRTLFTALHHFRPPIVRSILQDAVSKRATIAVFEPLERSWRFLLLLGIGSFVRGLTHTPRVGRLTWSRFFFTYPLPIAPLMFAWDGAVSVLRSYTPAELSALAEGIVGNGYVWTVDRFQVRGPFGSVPTTCLIGYPPEVSAKSRNAPQGGVSARSEAAGYAV